MYNVINKTTHLILNRQPVARWAAERLVMEYARMFNMGCEILEAGE